MIQNQSSSKPILGKSFLADLDGLLVDSKSFSQLFIQQCDPKWVENKLDKVAQSNLHLAKLVELLIHFITCESHPEWVRKALVWLNCFIRKYPREIQNPRIRNALKRLCSYVHEISGLEDPYFRAANRTLAIEKWVKSYKSTAHVPLSLYYSDSIPIPSTRYVYCDDSSSKSRPAKRRRTKQASRRSSNWSETEGLMNELDMHSSFGSESEILVKTNEFDPDEQEDEDDNQSDESMDSSLESDDGGVFDVDNPLSSDDQDEQQSDVENQGHSDEQADSADEDDQSSDYLIDRDQDEQKFLKENFIVDDLNSTAESSDESTDNEDDDNDSAMPLKLHLEDLGGKSDLDDDDDQTAEDEAILDETTNQEEPQQKPKSPKTKKNKNSPIKTPNKQETKSNSPSKSKSPSKTNLNRPVTRRSLRSNSLPDSCDLDSPSQSRTLRTRNKQNK